MPSESDSLGAVRYICTVVAILFIWLSFIITGFEVDFIGHERYLAGSVIATCMVFCARCADTLVGNFVTLSRNNKNNARRAATRIFYLGVSAAVFFLVLRMGDETIVINKSQEKIMDTVQESILTLKEAKQVLEAKNNQKIHPYHNLIEKVDFTLNHLSEVLDLHQELHPENNTREKLFLEPIKLYLEPINVCTSFLYSAAALAVAKASPYPNMPYVVHDFFLHLAIHIAMFTFGKGSFSDFVVVAVAIVLIIFKEFTKDDGEGEDRTGELDDNEDEDRRWPAENYNGREPTGHEDRRQILQGRQRRNRQILQGIRERRT